MKKRTYQNNESVVCKRSAVAASNWESEEDVRLNYVAQIDKENLERFINEMITVISTSTDDVVIINKLCAGFDEAIKKYSEIKAV